MVNELTPQRKAELDKVVEGFLNTSPEDLYKQADKERQLADKFSEEGHYEIAQRHYRKSYILGERAMRIENRRARRRK